MLVHDEPDEGNHLYQRQLATALVDGLGPDAGLETAQSNGWEGVLGVFLGKRPGTSRRSSDSVKGAHQHLGRQQRISAKKVENL